MEAYTRFELFSAEALNIRQASVAQMEKHSDLMISTLRGYIEGMSGALELVVELPDHAPMQIAGIGELDDANPSNDTIHFAQT